MGWRLKGKFRLKNCLELNAFRSRCMVKAKCPTQYTGVKSRV